MKLGGNRPAGDNPLLFSISGTGSCICPVTQTRLEIPRPLITQALVHLQPLYEFHCGPMNFFNEDLLVDLQSHGVIDAFQLGCPHDDLGQFSKYMYAK